MTDDKFEKWWDSTWIKDDDLYLEINKFAKSAYQAGYEQCKKDLEELELKECHLCGIKTKGYYCSVEHYLEDINNES